MQNVKSRAGSASNYKGVWRHKREEKWYSRITHNKILINLGSYANEKDAARAYDKKVIELFGEHAYLNLPRRIPRK